ncbi:DeoR family fructose operon transcriptional repressor [Clostridium acetobutylicum]|nr:MULTISPECIES: DeoR/GlpR family DNA-binding transcription regulator [Clostridium]NOV90231.1 DeoR family fructose operon transcriptional repressor [Clostridium acetobutylicum]NOW15242.1 DeoR family fructose operon transcriptional repressor [Clostridium acetobutylicum]NRY56921.1 DeoR family fructose operon transcriptional repressor [Clostridium acetobutylicum]NSA93667.1 DeoR family fructose operon transcriptional repressor [Clostridium acetobutylicum]
MFERWEKILKYLEENKEAEVQELMDAFNISRSTVRRDLIEMEKKALVKRTRGGVEIAKYRSEGKEIIEKIFGENKEAKIKIAKKAASLIKDDDFIFIDSGSTCYYLIDYIASKNVTVVTNGIMHIQKLIEKDIDTYVLGGYAKKERNLIMSEDVESKIGMMNFDISFLGTMGVDSIGGFKTNLMDDVKLKKAVIKASKSCYVLADASKFNVRKFYTYAKLEDLPVITDSKTDFDDESLKVILA